MYLLWFHCLFLFSLKFNCLQRVFPNEKVDDNCHVLQTTWKWSNWRLTREQDGTNVSLISHIHVRFLSCVISFIVLPTLPSPSSTVFLKFPLIFSTTYIIDLLTYLSCLQGPQVQVVTVAPKPNNWVCLSVFSCLFCIWPIGLAALVFSCMVSET